MPAGTRGPLRAKCAKAIAQRKTQVGRKRPAFPAQWLCRDLPGAEFVLASVVSGLTAGRPGRAGFASAHLAAATAARTTRFCRTRDSFAAAGFAGFVHATGEMLARRTIGAVRLHECRGSRGSGSILHPPCPRHHAPDAAASTASPPTTATTCDRPSCRAGQIAYTAIPNSDKENYFYWRGLTGFCPTGGDLPDATDQGADS